jgi:hypothetical protein
MSLAHGGKIDPIRSQREDCTAPAAGMQAEQDQTFQMLNVSGGARQARGFGPGQPLLSRFTLRRQYDGRGTDGNGPYSRCQ